MTKQRHTRSCKTDPILFIEKYCTIDGKPIVLSELQKTFLKQEIIIPSSGDAEFKLLSLEQKSEA